MSLEPRYIEITHYTDKYLCRVDAEDYEELSQYKWRRLKGNSTYYAVRHSRENGKARIIYMSRQIMNPPEGAVVDHINHNGLDNRKENLRVVSATENRQNSFAKKGYKGVCWDKARKKWKAMIHYKGKPYNLGRFDNEIEAAEAYDKAAREFGSIRLNFPKGSELPARKEA